MRLIPHGPEPRAAAALDGAVAAPSAPLAYVRAHGGGTVATSSQQGAATAIIRSDAEVAGIGGFSGRESAVTVAWLADEVQAGKIAWVVSGGDGGFGGNDGRTGATTAMDAVTRACREIPSSATGSPSSAPGSVAGQALYDCRGRAAALRAAG